MTPKMKTNGKIKDSALIDRIAGRVEEYFSGRSTVDSEKELLELLADVDLATLPDSLAEDCRFILSVESMTLDFSTVETPDVNEMLTRAVKGNDIHRRVIYSPLRKYILIGINVAAVIALVALIGFKFIGKDEMSSKESTLTTLVVGGDTKPVFVNDNLSVGENNNNDRVALLHNDIDDVYPEVIEPADQSKNNVKNNKPKSSQPSKMSQTLEGAEMALEYVQSVTLDTFDMLSDFSQDLNTYFDF